MANISLTTRCNRDCAFCFASGERRQGRMMDMPGDVYDHALDFLERSGVREVRLLGGEPVLHPDFKQYAERALNRGFPVSVFTGGRIPPAILDYLRALDRTRIAVVMNTAIPGVDADSLVAEQMQVCRELGDKVELGVTLLNPATNLDFMLQWIARFGLQRRIRIGLANPMADGTNRWMRSALLPNVGACLEPFIIKAESDGIQTGFDCGFTPCMFSRDFLETRMGPDTAMWFHCRAIPDILPDGSVAACFALASRHRTWLGVDSIRGELAALLDDELNRDLPTGVFKDCATCAYYADGHCGGGCRARRALRLRPVIA